MSLLSKLTGNTSGKEKAPFSRFTDKARTTEQETQRNQPQIIIECSQNNLLEGINIVLEAVPYKSTMDILECILIDASSEQVKLLANDMELGIETIIEGKIISKGIIALNAKSFAEIVRRLPDGNVIIEADSEYKTTITTKEIEINFIGKSGKEFPRLPIIEKKNGIIISQLELKEAIGQTIFSISDSGNVKLMTGELFEVNGNILKVVSTDGHRISVRNINIKNSYFHTKAVIPGDTLFKLSRILLEDIDKNINLFITEEYIRFEFDNKVVVSRLIEGEYFKIDHMLSNNYATKVTVDRRKLLDSINLAMFLGAEEKKPVIIEIENNSMKLYTDSSIGTMCTKINTQKSGKDIVIGFNPKFLMDALITIDSDDVNLYLLNAKAPCIFKDDKNRYTYLILPVSIPSIQTNTKPRKPTIQPPKTGQNQTTSTTPPVQTRNMQNQSTDNSPTVKYPFDLNYAPELCFFTNTSLSDKFPKTAGQGEMIIRYPVINVDVNIVEFAIIVDDCLIQFSEDGKMHVLNIPDNTAYAYEISGRNAHQDLLKWVKETVLAVAPKQINAVKKNPGAMQWLRLYSTILFYYTTNEIDKETYNTAMQTLREGFRLAPNDETIRIVNRQWYYNKERKTWGNIALNIFRDYFKEFSTYHN